MTLVAEDESDKHPDLAVDVVMHSEAELFKLLLAIGGVIVTY